jgi:hypothetical protein
VSSLTVARQRGILTRFPVFAERQRRAYRKNFERTEKTCEWNLLGRQAGSQTTVDPLRAKIRSKFSTTFHKEGQSSTASAQAGCVL